MLAPFLTAIQCGCSRSGLPPLNPLSACGPPLEMLMLLVRSSSDMSLCDEKTEGLLPPLEEELDAVVDIISSNCLFNASD